MAVPLLVEFSFPIKPTSMVQDIYDEIERVGDKKGTVLFAFGRVVLLSLFARWKVSARWFRETRFRAKLPGLPSVASKRFYRLFNSFLEAPVLPVRSSF